MCVRRTKGIDIKRSEGISNCKNVDYVDENDFLSLSFVYDSDYVIFFRSLSAGWHVAMVSCSLEPKSENLWIGMKWSEKTLEVKLHQSFFSLGVSHSSRDASENPSDELSRIVSFSPSREAFHYSNSRRAGKQIKKRKVLKQKMNEKWNENTERGKKMLERDGAESCLGEWGWM